MEDFVVVPIEKGMRKWEMKITEGEFSAVPIGRDTRQ